jgi:hypothetical protein
MLLSTVLVCHFFALSSALARHIIKANSIDDNDTLILYEKVHNLIENITMRQSVNTRLLIGTTASELSLIHRASGVANIVYSTTSGPLPERRDYAAIFLSPTNDNRLENWLNASLKLPPDSIKIYVNHNDCRLNESQLSEIMSKLWRSHDKIGFIYYISLCAPPPPYAIENTTTTRKSGGSDYGRRSQRNNYVINLFYYQPFQGHKSVASGQQQQQQHHHQPLDFGRMEKINLINASGVDVEWMDMSRSQAFHRFPFAPHKLNFNGYLLTVILFPSTMAYFRRDMSIFRRELSSEASHDPYHHVDAYFGEDVEALLELGRLLNFNISLSPTSDWGFYGFRVSE